MRSLTVGTVLCALVSGCSHSYVVEDGTLGALSRMEPEERKRLAVAAEKEGGEATWVRAETLQLQTAEKVESGSSKVRAKRRAAMVATGLSLSAVGALFLVTGGVLYQSSVNSDVANGFVAGVPLLSVGAGHLASGLVLSIIGLASSPESVDGLRTYSPEDADSNGTSAE